MALRVAILGGLVLAAFAVLFLRLWSLQILSSSHYLNEALNNQLRTDRIEAPRGPILDRNGRVLVTNAPGRTATVSPFALPKGDGRDTELRKLAMVLHVPLSRIEAKIREHRGDLITPVTVAVALHPDQVKYLNEHDAEFPGVRIQNTYLRYYNSEGLAAQLFGYVGEISAPELKHVRKCSPAQIQAPPPPSHQCYVSGDRIGQSGVEAAYDAYLRGTPGVSETRVDSRSQPLQGPPLLSKSPAPGDALR